MVVACNPRSSATLLWTVRADPAVTVPPTPARMHMFGGLRLFVLVLFITCFALIGALAFVTDDSLSTTSTSGPPKAKTEAVEDTIHGHKIVDPYRYLENA